VYLEHLKDEVGDDIEEFVDFDTSTSVKEMTREICDIYELGKSREYSIWAENGLNFLF